MTRIIFLDIDGVLLPFGSNNNAASLSSTTNRCGLFPMEKVQALSYIVERTDARIVLSSTWRVRPDYCEDILQSLRAYDRGPLSTMTEFYDTTDIHNHSERQWEIWDYLMSSSSSSSSGCNHDDSAKRQRLEITKGWVALDDEELLEGPKNAKHRARFLGHVVKTDSATGLTMADAEKAVKILLGQD